jgi:hypothetical protein
MGRLALAVITTDSSDFHGHLFFQTCHIQTSQPPSFPTVGLLLALLVALAHEKWSGDSCYSHQNKING